MPYTQGGIVDIIRGDMCVSSAWRFGLKPFKRFNQKNGRQLLKPWIVYAVKCNFRVDKIGARMECADPIHYCVNCSVTSYSHKVLIALDMACKGCASATAGKPWPNRFVLAKSSVNVCHQPSQFPKRLNSVGGSPMQKWTCVGCICTPYLSTCTQRSIIVALWQFRREWSMWPHFCKIQKDNGKGHQASVTLRVAIDVVAPAVGLCVVILWFSSDTKIPHWISLWFFSRREFASEVHWKYCMCSKSFTWCLHCIDFAAEPMMDRRIHWQSPNIISSCISSANVVKTSSTTSFKIYIVDYILDPWQSSITGRPILQGSKPQYTIDFLGWHKSNVVSPSKMGLSAPLFSEIFSPEGGTTTRSDILNAVLSYCVWGLSVYLVFAKSVQYRSLYEDMGRINVAHLDQIFLNEDSL